MFDHGACAGDVRFSTTPFVCSEALSVLSTLLDQVLKTTARSSQMDLFAAQIAGGAPDWPDLPKDAQEALVGLMTRLILEHARTTTAPTKRLGAGHDH